MLYFNGKFKLFFIAKVIIKTYKLINKENSIAFQLSGLSANFTSRECHCLGGPRRTAMKVVNRGEEKYETSIRNSMKEGGQL